MTGTIKWYDPRKGYGFIIPDGCTPASRELHVFVHETALEDSASARAGLEVEYSLLPGYPTPRALTVRLLGKRSYVPINSHSQEKKVAYGD